MIFKSNQLIANHARLGIRACFNIPHDPLEAETLMNPDSPHPVPHEFLIIHVPSA